MPPVILVIVMPSQHPVSCLTCCYRRMPGQGLAPMLRGPDQESLEVHWGLDLAPMEHLPHTPVIKENPLNTRLKVSHTNILPVSAYL